MTVCSCMSKSRWKLRTRTCQPMTQIRTTMTERNESLTTTHGGSPTTTTTPTTPKPGQEQGNTPADTGKTDGPTSERKDDKEADRKDIPDPARTTAKETPDNNTPQGSAK